ncbi:MAG: hypothetical protein P8M22_13265 [Phycisphaerales bacterium]|nr:hypothetical protein [Phycisphaerales bacterium]
MKHPHAYLIAMSLLATCHWLSPAHAESGGGGNYTPGNGIGNDHSAYLFSPFYWQIDDGDNFDASNNGEHHYLKYTCSGGGKGQQYQPKTFWEQQAAGANTPQHCNLLTFHEIINQSDSDLGTLYIVTHGGSTSMVVEAYAATPAGRAARDARYQAYLAGKVEGQPELEPGDITDSWNMPDYVGIAVTHQFIAREVNLPGALVYLGSCTSASLTTAFTNGDNGARVAIGNNAITTPAENTARIKKVFSSLDGQQRQAKRVLSAAVAGMGGQITVTGMQNTTLAPSVLTKSFTNVECPEVGESIDIKFDTACDANVIPVLDTDCCKWQVQWQDAFTIRATLTQDDPDDDFVRLSIDWNTVKSARNEARLDGNRTQSRNARGRAHDDFNRNFKCDRTCSGDVTGDDTVNIEDLLGIIGSWGSSNDDQNNDGVTDISDLLLVLDVFGTTCVGGSCCLGDYCLDDVSESTCDSIEGSWDSAFPICEVQECVAIGTCCFATTCDVTLGPDDCEINGGTFLEGTDDCEEAQCVNEPGSCCLGISGCVSDITPSDCEGLGGLFMGEISCDSNYCEPMDISGACCLGDGVCIEAVGPECDLAGGTWNGELTGCDSDTCGVIGACCADVPGTPSCTDMITEDLCDSTTGTFYPDMTCDDLYAAGECQDELSACCDDESCWETSEAECTKMGGTFTPGINCSSVECVVGACCLGDACTDGTTESECTAKGGMFFPGGSCGSVPCF